MSASFFPPSISEAFLDLQIYERALYLFEDDPSLSGILHKHLLKMLAAPIVDQLIQSLIMDSKLKKEIKIKDGENFDAAQLTSENRISLAKRLPDSLSAKVQAVVEALEGKHVGTFMAAFKDLAKESGLPLKKLDEQLEKSLLLSYGKNLTSEISIETDPLILLPKIVALLYLQVHNKALQTPRNSIAALISRLEDKLSEEAFKVLMDYHKATVTLLSLQSAATEDAPKFAIAETISFPFLGYSKLPAKRLFYTKYGRN